MPPRKDGNAVESEYMKPTHMRVVVAVVLGNGKRSCGLLPS